MKEKSVKNSVLVRMLVLLLAIFSCGCGRTEEKPQDTQVEKRQITIGWNENIVPQLLEAAMVEFNKSSQEYEVVIAHYDWQTGQQQLEMELATGRGPDLFDMSMVYGKKLAEKGLIEDLSPYLEDGDGLEREDLVENVLACNTMEGVLTCVPARFELEVLLGKKSLIGEKGAWSVEDFLNSVQTHEGIIVSQGVTVVDSEVDNQYSIVRTVLHGNTEYFLDAENPKAAFDKEEFKELLRFAKEYQTGQYDYGTRENTRLQVKEGELLLSSATIYSVEEYMLAKSILGEETMFVSHPSYESNTGYCLQNVVACGMNPNSQVKEGAWKFIEFLIQYRFADVQLEHGFFSEKSGLEEEFAEAMEKITTLSLVPDGVEPIEIPKWSVTYGNGELIEAYAATKEDIASLKALIDGADRVYDLGSNSIFKIAEEEVLAYLYEDKSLEETISMIQNRVQLYLDEQN